MFKRMIIPILLVAAGLSVAVGYLGNPIGGTAQGAVAMNRVSTTCAKAGYDGRFFTKQVDPIVSHGIAVSAHNHNFFGLVNISSSFSAGTYPLRAGHEDDPGYEPSYSNCPFYGDWPLGWYPVAKLNGVDLTPTTLTDTWQAPKGTPVITPPFGTSFIAGDSHGTAPNAHVGFTCGGNLDGLGANLDNPVSAKPIDCSGVPGGVVTAQLTFPDCWDGLGATRPDPLKQWVFDGAAGIDPKHFYYSTDGKCPPGTVPCVPGKLMAQLVTQETWIDNRQTLSNGVANPDFNKPLRNPLNVDGSIALSFSSGDYLTYHGDYIQTWNHYLADIINTCLNGNVSCPYGTRIGLHNLE